MEQNYKRLTSFNTWTQLYWYEYQFCSDLRVMRMPKALLKKELRRGFSGGSPRSMKE